MINQRKNRPFLTILTAIFLVVRISYAQEYVQHTVDSLLEARELQEARKTLKNVDTLQLGPSEKLKYAYQLGSLLFYEDNNEKAYQILSNCRKKIDKSTNKPFLFSVNDKLIEITGATTQYDISPKDLIKENCDIAYELKDPELLYDCYYYQIAQAQKDLDEKKALHLLFEILQIVRSAKLTHLEANLEVNIGSSHKRLGQIDSAFYYYEKAEKKYKEKNDHLRLAYLYNNVGSLYQSLEQYDIAIDYYTNAYNTPFNQEKYSTKLFILGNISRAFYAKGDFKNAANSYQNYIHLSDSLDRISHQKNIDELETEYQTAEKEKQLLISEQKKKQNRNVAYGLGIGLFLVSLLGFFMYKNTKRKQRIAEQEREIEIQKKEKILKEQELNAIDAMIAGQEKERQRLASDLHDSVGATLSAAKLQFDHIAKNKTKLDQLDELFEKTGTLLDEAYNEVRTMAHLKNSGVIAKKGLLPAIEKLAKNASSSHGLMIEVQDFGLTEKLEGSLEISIFRIIQELVTNIIKHANATEASISITQHEDTLSIIVEDNGVGFNVRNINKKEGMGLSSIETRVEHLEGTMEVDTTLQKGTNILIDIPL